MKKLFSTLLVFAMILASFSLAFADGEVIFEDLTQEVNDDYINIDQFEQSIEQFKEEFDFEAQMQQLNLEDEEQIRLIVELDGNPVINHATSENKKVNELNTATIKSLTKKIVTEQKAIKSTLSRNYNIEYHRSFQNVFNGFSCTTTVKEAKNLEKLPGVKNVYVAAQYNRPKPLMQESVTTVGARTLWGNLGLTGEGTVVSIIDSGIDPSHKDMVLTDSTKKKLNKTFVDGLNLKGTWRTDKIPYGYNYYDKNQEILDLGQNATRHGMHVAGIVGANGNESTGGIKGVAPECQLLAMKVFSNGTKRTTSSDVYIKAIDDSILMGADVINMSLGSPAGHVVPDFPAQKAIKRAVNNGIVVAVSAGNSHRFGRGFSDPLTSNPDTGVVGTPGVTLESFQVASTDNTSYLYKQNIAVEGLTNNVIGYGKDNWTKLLSNSQNLQLVAIGGTKLGKLTDYDNIDVTGKVVLVKRGEHSFKDKTDWANQKGAKAIIVYDHGLSTFHKDQGGWSIPFAKISKEDGEAIEALLVNGAVTINVSLNEKYVNPKSGQLSNFSSWGLTPNLVFKPEITAPGGRITSTDQTNQSSLYQLMSGTSMSSPCVAGGSALVLQYVKQKFPNLSGADKVEMVKKLIMSTANPIVQKLDGNETEFTSPRGQGAGVMDLVKATSAKAIVVDSLTGQTKVALNEIGNNVSFKVTIKNLTNNPLYYTVSGSVATDLPKNGKILAIPQSIVNANGETPIEFNYPTNPVANTILVPANGSTDVNVSVNLSNVKGKTNNKTLNAMFENGCFVEGFVQFKEKSSESNLPSLSIPYCGFYGSWDDAPILDGTKYDSSSFYGVSGIIEGNKYYYLGQNADKTFDKNKIAFSPNGDNSYDTIIPLFSFYRNARKIDIDILDSNNNKILDFVDDEYIYKSFGDGENKYTYYFDSSWKWNGKVNNVVQPDGQYYMKVRTVIDYPNAEWNEKVFPIKLDTTKPIFTNLTYNQQSTVLTATATDAGSSVYQYVLLKGSEVVERNTTGQFTINKLGSGTHTLKVAVIDYARNVSITNSFNLTIQ
ncbi:S8 family serine peptidase [Clostridiaceae bacterium M8S5]|nr:S8 family serine peptidase [Clostridiaceae bacterium M8S5]